MKGTFELEATIPFIGEDNAARGDKAENPTASIEIVFDMTEDVRAAVGELHTALTQLGLVGA